MNEQELALLVRRAQGGDREAFGKLYLRYYHLLFIWMYKRIYDVTRADEIVAETFIRLWESLSGYGELDASGFRRLMYTICRNYQIDCRRKNFHGFGYLELKPDLIQIPDVITEERLESWLLESRIHTAFSELTPDQRQVLGLRCLEGCTNYEVAQILGKTEGAVKSIYHRARARLRGLLTPSKNGRTD